tara:strand:- start:294 stop:443 length:150 start_codon:yes stop_codon:yes gene_type:complete
MHIDVQHKNKVAGSQGESHAQGAGEKPNRNDLGKFTGRPWTLKPTKVKA